MDRTTFRRVEISNTRTIRGRLYAQFWHRNSCTLKRNFFSPNKILRPKLYNRKILGLQITRLYIYIYIYLLLGKRNNLITFVIHLINIYSSTTSQLDCYSRSNLIYLFIQLQILLSPFLVVSPFCSNFNLLSFSIRIQKLQR